MSIRVEATNNYTQAGPIPNENLFCDILYRVGRVAAAILTYLILSVYEILTFGCNTVAYLSTCLFTAEPVQNGGRIQELFNWAGLVKGPPMAPEKEVVKPLLPEPLIAEPLIPDEEMALRKLNALERLRDIKAGKLEFELNPEVLQFDLDAALSKYSSIQNTSKFLDLFDYANPGPEYSFGKNRSKFNAILEDYRSSYRAKKQEQYKTVNASLSRLSELFNKKRERVKGNVEQENALKQQIRYTVLRFIDASDDCVDQALAQLEHVLVESIASEASPGKATPEKQLQACAAALLFQYKSNLVTTSCQRLFPKECHMADFERVVKQQVGPSIGLEAKVNNVGAYYNFEPGVEGEELTLEMKKNRVYLAQCAVLRRYNHDNSFLPENQKDFWNDIDERPFFYLLREAKVADGYSPANPLRSSMVAWALQHYMLEEDNEITANLVQEGSIDKENDYTIGGHFNESGLLWLLDAAGIIREVK